MVYPTAAAPTQGIFVERRIRAMHAVSPIVMVSPQPWFPGWRPALDQPLIDESAAPTVIRPRMFYIPGIMKRWDAAFYAAAFREGLQLARERGPVKVIDAHFEWPDGVGAWQVAREERLPFVCTLRGKLVSQSRNPVRRGMLGEMLREADRLIAVSASLARLARDVAGRPLNVEVIPNGIDDGVFFRSGDEGRSGPDPSARASLGWHPGARYVVSVGHFQRLKGFHRLVHIWPEVRRLAGDVRLVLVGGSAGEPAYERELMEAIRRINGVKAASGDGSIIACAGRVSPDRVAQLLNAADLFALASESEGWCNAIAEALACGCPVVATDVGGNREIVVDDTLGRLAPLEDSNALTTAIAESLDRGWDRGAIASTGRGRRWADVGQACVEALQGVIR